MLTGSFWAAVQFLTVFPSRAELEENDLGKSPFWFPVVGTLIGLTVAFADALLLRVGLTVTLRAVLSVGLLAAIQGGLHLDGLADTADGFFSHRSKERTLEIMRDSRIGTMGAVALFFVLTIKICALTGLDEALRWRALLLAPLAGRSTMTVMMVLLPYARTEGGLATVFARGSSKRVAWWSGLYATVISLLMCGVRGIWIIVSCLIGGVLLGMWYKKRIGGYTGDTLGATSELTEAVVLVIIATM